jgi:hypothetical protein
MSRRAKGSRRPEAGLVSVFMVRRYPLKIKGLFLRKQKLIYLILTHPAKIQKARAKRHSAKAALVRKPNLGYYKKI